MSRKGKKSASAVQLVPSSADGGSGGGHRQTRSDPAQGQLALGQWYWVLPTADEKREARREGVEVDFEPELGAWLGCVMAIGTNYLELEAPKRSNWTQGTRVHFDDFWTKLRYEPNAEEVIRGRIAKHQQRALGLMNQVQQLTQRLGLSGRASAAPALPGGTPAAPRNELVVLSGQVDVRSYERSLVQAKEKDLPKLYKEIEESNHDLAQWMGASILPMKAQMTPMRDHVEQIEGRIFTISLYAGLSEEAVQCATGAPASADEKLHVMQRMLMMDEECLLEYKAGGIDIRSIDAFSKWLAKPKNRDRILPFPRTLVAMRVRRAEKEREVWSLADILINISLDKDDKATFLFVRNGDQIWRIRTETEFDELIFPDPTVFAPDEPKMFKRFGRSVDELMSLSEYEARAAEAKERRKKYEAWQKANPGVHHFNNPHHESFGFNPDEWTLLSQDSVYYDDVMGEIRKQVEKHNRVAVIIQGLFDRSPVLQPHHPVRSWTAGGFEQAIKLIYDSYHALHHGEAPDFEAYRAKLNASFGVGSIAVGQERAWMRHEAKKAASRYRSGFAPRYLRPYGNPGPGLVAEVKGWSKKGQAATFEWERDRVRRYLNPGTVRSTIKVEAKELLNVSAYTPGDFRQFYADPRTRAKYLQWAPLMLAAEEYHAGKLELGKPGKEE